MKAGFVYVMGNAYMPRVYKVGATQRSPHARADELSAATGVPVDFQVLGYAEFADAFAIEAEIHDVFCCERINSGREFFEAPLQQLLDAICDHPDRLSAWTAEKDASVYERPLLAVMDGGRVA
ncbi:GIY-YIG nuclease family protein [Pusillimonas caeni]|uniref:GIY-YIG nuclease family protein n=1 Tax=Pusillimonas caeni TaxID=1348472 RepID=UPI000E599543|nr:GIY-YIG nuclease family protein [Pusillimonas caeni]TFL14198.1 GIY-YIG nuclease family protein [Pusillimonas caeni]